MTVRSCEACEKRDRLIDELVWALDHLDGRRGGIAQEVDAIIARGRLHVAEWHAARTTIDLRGESTPAKERGMEAV